MMEINDESPAKARVRKSRTPIRPFQCGKLCYCRRKCYKGKEHAGHVIGKSSPGLMLEVSDNTEDGDSCKDTESAVQEGCHKGIIYDV